jgi:hypothetical protein
VFFSFFPSFFFFFFSLCEVASWTVFIIIIIWIKAIKVWLITGSNTPYLMIYRLIGILEETSCKAVQPR